ncbi:uncharacterized protein si:ch73-109d9.3 isoform X2 [Antennarius striatus]|uniref:uncharacterized protein si:ch73-109d9.3 isoform X2 n=1 Tax=Antennarius striatus TaxID=241820 RepID=UPI0035B48E0D
MSELEALMVAFQTRLSDVMEAVVKTAVVEVTRLVEDGLLREVKRRNQEVESLRVQLRWAERKDGGKAGRCADCGREDAEQKPREQEDMLRDGSVKKEGDSAGRWTNVQQEVTPEMPRLADSPTPSDSPESQDAKETDVLPAVDVKREELNKPSCSALLLVGWSDGVDAVGTEFHGAPEMMETGPEQPQETSEDLLRNSVKQDLQICTAYVLHEEQEEKPMVPDRGLDVDGGWTGIALPTAGLLQTHGHAPERDCDPAHARGSLVDRESSTCNTTDMNALAAPGRDPISASASPTARRSSDAPGVTVKQEVIVDSDECVETERKGKKIRKSGTTAFSVKSHRVGSEQFKQNHISHKATAQEVMRLHSKFGAGVRLQAALQHLHRPVKKPPHMLSHGASSSPAHSQAVSLNPLHRNPSTSKALPPPLSIQRVHPGNKPAHSRTCAPWVSIKTQLQSANSHQANPLTHPGSHPHATPRHLLRCGQCGRCFPHPSNLKAHLQTHTGERPFCCSLCGRSFTKLSNLKAHRRVHTGERPYSCSACGKCFTQKCNLKRHQRIHLDV